MMTYYTGPASKVEALDVSRPWVRLSLDGSQAILKTDDDPGDLPAGVRSLDHSEAIELVAGPAWLSQDPTDG